MITNKLTRKRIAAIVTLLILSVFLIFEIVLSNFSIKTTDYNIQLEGVSLPVRVVALSDLHCREFGKGNSRLLDKIKAQ